VEQDIAAGHYTNIAGKKITARQITAIAKLEAQAVVEDPDFDPRDHRIPHGIRPMATSNAFEGIAKRLSERYR